MTSLANTSSTAIETWGGVESTVNRVGGRWFDQTRRSGHHDRIEDLDRFAALGLHALRYPVLWERVAPTALAMPDFSWSDARLNRIRDLGMRPIIGLVHHGSGPAYTSLLDPQFPTLLERYARMVAERYPWVTDYTPINEPLTTARFSGLYGVWYPHARDAHLFVRALITQLRAVVLAMAAIRSVTPNARLVQTEDCGRTFGRPAAAEQVDHEAHRRWLTWDLLTGKVDVDHPLHDYLRAHGTTESDIAFFLDQPCPPDIIGLNYYLTSDRYLDERVHDYPVHHRGGNGRLAYADVDAVRARPEGIAGHQAHMMAAWQRYALPIAVTEVHLSCTRDEQVRWLVECWLAARRARAAGVDVRAITAWALLGSFDWDTLVTESHGHYEPGVFDTRSVPPRRTALASIIKTISSNGTPDHPVLDGPAWWTRPERLLYAQHAQPALIPSGSRRMLITGASGTLGRAIRHECSIRGLPMVAATRADCDVTVVTAVTAMLDRVRPWAVINAAGYVRVDDAEVATDACRHANVVGAVVLAEECGRRGIPFVTFSSDLVFDGASARAYTERDAPRPIGVYGQSKADAEEGVRAVLPEALIIRSSAFFGPGDVHNFAAQVCSRLVGGDQFAASADHIVSPTYVPDLVNASLDLLIDGETGIWHLANQGALSWFAFAQAVAIACRLPVERVQPLSSKQSWALARRPLQSALTSVRGNLMPPLDAAIAAFAAHHCGRSEGIDDYTWRDEVGAEVVASRRSHDG